MERSIFYIIKNLPLYTKYILKKDYNAVKNSKNILLNLLKK